MADYFESGFCVRDRSWHGKENLLSEADAPKTWDEARMAAGLMWEPRLAPLYRKVTVDGVESFVEAEAQAVERDDTGAELGTVSKTFELITHADMGEILEPLLAQPNVRFDTAGSVKEGRSVFATLLLDEPYQVAGDIDGFGDATLTLPYFAILNSHDGTGACKGLFTQVRVVCANTVQAADADGNRHGSQFTLRHTSGVRDRLTEARDIVAACRVEAARWRQMAEALCVIRITPEQQVQFLSEFIPAPAAGIVSPRVMANIEADRVKFLHVLRNSTTNGAMQDNALGLVNASIEYLDHVRGFRNSSTYMGRQILAAEPLKAKAIKLVRELVNA